MEFSSGIGGVTLVLLAVVWLAVFVPSWSKRSEIKEIKQTVHRDVKAAQVRALPTSSQQIHRLLRTQRVFSAIFFTALMAAAFAAVAAQQTPSWWGAVGFAAALASGSLFLSRAAARAANTKLLVANRARQLGREQVSRELQNSTQPKNREWTPNPLPAPMAVQRAGEIIVPIAEVIELAARKQSLNSSEIDEILRRRRVI